MSMKSVRKEQREQEGMEYWHSLRNVNMECRLKDQQNRNNNNNNNSNINTTTTNPINNTRHGNHYVDNDDAEVDKILN